MGCLKKVFLFAILCSSAFALEMEDQLAIEEIIQGYTDSWNIHKGRGFGDGYAEDADFVNIFGMKFSGREEIEQRHIDIINSFFKGSKLEIVDSQLREVYPGLVIASVYWKLDGFRKPGSDPSSPGETRKGIYTQVFVQSDDKWEITASQNTLMN